MLTSGLGGQEAAIYLAMEPDAASRVIERFVTIGACHVSNESKVARFCPSGEEEEEENDRDFRNLKSGRAYEHRKEIKYDRNLRRNLSSMSSLSGNSSSPSKSRSCNKNDYFSELRRIRYEVLSYSDYRHFYRILKNLRRGAGKEFYCAENWTKVVNEALCKVDKNLAVCQPARQKCIIDMIAYLRDDCAADSVFGLGKAH